MGDPAYPFFSVFAFVGFVISLLPLAWLSSTWNAGTRIFIFWVSIGCLNQFINSIIWHGNTRNIAPVWCDISSRLIIGENVALHASALCIGRRLYKITNMQFEIITPQQIRRALVEDLCIGLGIPIAQMALEYIVEGRRFVIYEDVGCWPQVYNVWPAYPLFFALPPALSLISFLYDVLIFRSYFKLHKELNAILSHASFHRNQYFTLLIFIVVDTLFSTPASLYVLIITLKHRIYPYIGWADTHSYYSQIREIPAIVWRSSPSSTRLVETNRWWVVLSAVVFYGVWGFTSQARRVYKKVFWAIVRPFGLTPSPKAVQNMMEFEVGRNPVITSSVSPPIASVVGRESNMSVISNTDLPHPFHLPSGNTR